MNVDDTVIFVHGAHKRHNTTVKLTLAMAKMSFRVFSDTEILLFFFFFFAFQLSTVGILIEITAVLKEIWEECV